MTKNDETTVKKLSDELEERLKTIISDNLKAELKEKKISFHILLAQEPEGMEEKDENISQAVVAGMSGGKLEHLYLGTSKAAERLQSKLAIRQLSEILKDLQEEDGK